MNEWPVEVLFGIPAAAIVVGIIGSYALHRWLCSVDRMNALFAQADAAELALRRVSYRQPTAVPVDPFTRIGMNVKARDLAIRIDGGRYARLPANVMYAAPA
ncbi:MULTISPECIES: hypothetical protein [Paraburkholderia]|jgi:hypothetical protein|uniref:Uncharacterized protein n=1 Tax=Paraburkholderia tropica TaxID=92647 RepID=A0A1A5XF93_9BURK|nr:MULTISPECIES: hypothetical protein [Paraburkholderia]MBB2978816.1 hypothetical protein [Paraburkholderia tropica]MBB2999354.1 hypothetical protein [Paraburkholderia tropica]MBB6318746.1 hypothetical protein [Paraburkholderia tropica]MBN3807996.1 hypothetical protein [Paraburkholderia sp. Ac-20347]MDE1139077.1 hypothetical protein [Paraburkholderia tropica]